MNKSKTISLYRLFFFYGLTIIYLKPVVIIVSCIYLLIDNYKETLIYLVLVLWLYIYNLFSFDLTSFLFKLNDINPFYIISLKRLESFSNPIKSVLNDVLFNINDYQNNYNFGYGIMFYSLVRYMLKTKDKNKEIIIYFLLFLYINFFGWQDKYLLIIIPKIIEYLKLTSENKSFLSLIIILIINPNFINNYSFLISIIMQLIRKFDLGLNFKTLLIIIQSILFKSISLISLYKHEFFIYTKLFTIVFCLLIFIFKPSIKICSFIFFLIDKINNLMEIGIRGKISLFVLFLYLIFIKTTRMNNKYIQIITLLIAIIIPINYPCFEIDYIDVGQGDSCLIKDVFNSKIILIDTGSVYNYQKLKSYLYSKGIYKIDYLIITHEDEDHSGNIKNLQNNFYIKEVIKNGKDISINKTKLKYYYLTDFNDLNDNSLIYSLKVNNLSFLFTGDISSLAEAKFINEYGYEKFNVLKVSHHGSYTGSSDYFISNILPRYAIISTNGKYDHPHYSTLETLNKYIVKTFITKEDGNIEFIFNRLFTILKTNNDFVIIR